MNIILNRQEFRSDGIFGFILDSNYKFLFTCLEHSYDCLPKLPKGKYSCVRGLHKLHDGIEFEAFEVMDVPNHTGILFHIGNYNEDSEGCILLGVGFGQTSSNGKMITGSKQALKAFMELQKELDSFTLIVDM